MEASDPLLVVVQAFSRQRENLVEVGKRSLFLRKGQAFFLRQSENIEEDSRRRENVVEVGKRSLFLRKGQAFFLRQSENLEEEEEEKEEE